MADKLTISSHQLPCFGFRYNRTDFLGTSLFFPRNCHLYLVFAQNFIFYLLFFFLGGEGG